MPPVVCSTCGYAVDEELRGCPCGLGPECPVRRGVCAWCFDVITMNRAGRIEAPKAVGRAAA
jgi:hypothetical protein